VIVRCERCETRFKLDESRLPARGARVRCSRCKHAFFVVPPGASPEERVHDAAADAVRAADAARPSGGAPEPSWDLEENPGATRSRSLRSGAPDRSAPPRPRPTAKADVARGEEEDSEWRFEDEVPGLETSGADLDLSSSSSGIGLVPDGESDPNESSFAGLGDPETWDLLSTTLPPEPAPTIQPPAAAEAPATHTPSQVAEPPAEPLRAAGPAPASAPVAAPAETTSATEPAAEASSLRPREPLALRAAGWLVTLGLVAAIGVASLRPAPRAIAAAELAPVSGLEVASLRGRIVDNAPAGPVLVVSGRLRNPGPGIHGLDAPLRVQLLDAAGEPIPGETVAAGPALDAERLRLDDPAQLHAEQAARADELSRRRLAPGAELAFEAVFPQVPQQAARAALVTGSQQAAAPRRP